MVYCLALYFFDGVIVTRVMVWGVMYVYSSKKQAKDSKEQPYLCYIVLG
jgi:hypothetical protein